MKITILKLLTTKQLFFNSNRKIQLDIISRLPKEKIIIKKTKKSKVLDKIFDKPIPNFLRYKN